MKIQRRHTQVEVDIRWRAKKRWLTRTHCSSGEWVGNGTKVEHRTLDCQLKPRRPTAQALRVAQDLSAQVKGVRLSRIISERSVRHQIEKVWQHDMTYLEFEDQGVRRSRIQPSNSIGAFESWVKKYFDFRTSPSIRYDSLEADILVFSSEAFGCLLHEAVGHRSESDDFTTPLSRASELARPNFDVWDWPGQPSWHGYTPMGDDGTEGIAVQLLNRRSGKGKLLTEASGNLRSASASYHPLIRQRCLEVNVSAEIVPPSKSKTIFIDELKVSSFNGEFVVLESAIQWLLLKEGSWQKKKRLPSLRIVLRPEDIYFWKAFGEKRIFHPGGGCQKGNQNHLPVTFVAPQGWCHLSRVHLIELIVQTTNEEVEA